MMILIIAEKPSLARNIVSAIGTMKRNDGYYSNQNYLVTWAFGHLFSLVDIEEYDQNESPNTKWKMDNLPCFPKVFKFDLRKDSTKKIDAGVQKQFNIIKALCNREDVTKIVNAGDSDREGEIIVRLCIHNALNSEKEIYRLWLPDQTSETITQGLKEMKLDKEYDNLAMFTLDDRTKELIAAKNYLAELILQDMNLKDSDFTTTYGDGMKRNLVRKYPDMSIKHNITNL